MRSALESLTELQAEMNHANEPYVGIEDMRRLCFFEVGELLHIDYYGPYRRDYDEEEEDAGISDNQLRLFETLVQPEVASRVASLILAGPDEGCDCTKEWDFSWLLAQDVTFPELENLIIRPAPLEAHNRAMVGCGQEESGQLAGWLSRAPKLRKLTTPSAPNSAFFEVEHEPLYSMQVGAGWDHQDFILNLGRQSSPTVAILDWDDVHNDICEWQESAVPYQHYEALFTSPGCPGDVILRHPNLSDEQLMNLVDLHRKTRRGSYTSLRVFRMSYRLNAHADPLGGHWETDELGNQTNHPGTYDN
jgi:hypothetical protein